jgi:tryptophan synthase alpha subunit
LPLYLILKVDAEQSDDLGAASVSAFLKRCRSVTSCPLALGFGISHRDQFVAASNIGADGVVIGSAILRVIENAEAGQHQRDLGAFIKQVLGKA